MRDPFFRDDRRLLISALIFAGAALIAYVVIRALGLVR